MTATAADGGPPRSRVAALRAGAAELVRDGALGGLVGTTGLIGVGGAMVTSSVSLFLADEVKAAPLMIGLFFAGRAVLEISSDLVVGVMSDRIGNRRTLLAVCSLLSAAGAFSYMVLREYYLLFAAGAVFFGLGSACFSQLFAYTREFADHRTLNAAFFNAALRSVTSVAWIVGPPLAFVLIGSRGFAFLFCTAGVLYLAAGALCVWRLPNLAPAADSAAGVRRPYSGLPRSTWLLLAAIVLLLAVNSVYQIDISLFVTRDLGLDTGFTGVLLGLSAALEVPVMIFFGARARRIGLWRLMGAAAVCATLFFCLLPLATSPSALVALQLLNAFWTSVVLSVPVTILQDAMATRVGVASSLYSGAFKAGILLGGSTTGVVTEWAGFTDVFWVCAALAAAATLLLALGRDHGKDRTAVQRGRADVQPGTAAAAHPGVAGPADTAG
ncbi:sugar efflux transporter [Streptomyces sp. NPDC046831]|uniref:sugar efflux transporter n=1 Tax=Streptomyces sp. NPDC046831 TaxID=3154805 RepID=UPI0033E6510F